MRTKQAVRAGRTERARARPGVGSAFFLRGQPRLPGPWGDPAPQTARRGADIKRVRRDAPHAGGVLVDPAPND